MKISLKFNVKFKLIKHYLKFVTQLLEHCQIIVAALRLALIDCWQKCDQTKLLFTGLFKLSLLSEFYERRSGSVFRKFIHCPLYNIAGGASAIELFSIRFATRSKILYGRVSSHLISLSGRLVHSSIQSTKLNFSFKLASSFGPFRFKIFAVTTPSILI